VREAAPNAISAKAIKAHGCASKPVLGFAWGLEGAALVPPGCDSVNGEEEGARDAADPADPCVTSGWKGSRVAAAAPPADATTVAAITPHSANHLISPSLGEIGRPRHGDRGH
jgi:hypothetical protein